MLIEFIRHSLSNTDYFTIYVSGTSLPNLMTDVNKEWFYAVHLYNSVLTSVCL